jgi:hypothetical protein
MHASDGATILALDEGIETASVVSTTDAVAASLRRCIT